MKIGNLKLGQWVRVTFEDESYDGIVVEKDHKDDPKPLRCRVFFPSGMGIDGPGTDIVDADQIVMSGDNVTSTQSGLA